MKNAWKRTVLALYLQVKLKKMKIWKRIIMMTKKMACQKHKKTLGCSSNKTQKTCFKTKSSLRAITALKISRLIVANRVLSHVHSPKRYKLDPP